MFDLIFHIINLIESKHWFYAKAYEYHENMIQLLLIKEVLSL